MEDLVLHVGNKSYSSWSLRAWLALRQTGAPFTELLVDLGDVAAREALRQVSPAGRVPVLVAGDLVVWDSLAICEFLAERFPAAGLWPEDRRARAVARSAVAEMHAGFGALRSQMPMDLRRSGATRPRGADVDGDVARILDLWGSCLTRFGSGGPFLFGRQTVADAFFAPVVSRFRTYGVPLEGPPQAYADAVWQLPAFAEWRAAAVAETTAPSA